jgi:endonuclease V-like protein UPF0215 family
MRCLRKPAVRRFRHPDGRVVVASAVTPAPSHSGYNVCVYGYVEDTGSPVWGLGFYADEEIL